MVARLSSATSPLRLDSDQSPSIKVTISTFQVSKNQFPLLSGSTFISPGHFEPSWNLAGLGGPTRSGLRTGAGSGPMSERPRAVPGGEQVLVMVEFS